MDRVKQTTTGLFWVAILFFTNSVQAGSVYSIVDLGTLPDNNISFSMSINAFGQTTGFSHTEPASSNNPRAFVTDNFGVMRDIGTLGGIWSYGLGINSSGQVTGISNTAFGGGHAFMTTNNNEMVDLGTLGGSYDSSEGHDINDLGQVAGGSYTVDNKPHAFVTDTTGLMRDLGTLGGPNSVGLGINNSGQVTGFSETTAFGIPHAFVTDIDGVMRDLGTLGGLNSYGEDINDLGQVVGWSATTENYLHAFITDTDGEMIDLGSLGGNHSRGFGINSFGQVVGFSQKSDDGKHYAFIAENGFMTNLNTLLLSTINGWELTDATDINDAGQITGYGFHDGATRAFLLTPVSAVPEPGDIWLFISGLLGLFSVKPRPKSN